jgi:hypothetical protein
MTHSRLRIDVQGRNISITMRGTCLRATYSKGDAPWLTLTGIYSEDPDAPCTLSEFRAWAWEAATAKASELAWIA